GALPMGACTGPCYPAFPFFTPDSKGIVFGLTSQPDFVGSFPGRDAVALAELWYVDIASTKHVLLKNANTSLDPKDLQANFSPPWLPVQVGGYFWASWPWRRSWGTRLDPNASPLGLPIPPGFSVGSAYEAYKKRIWVTALHPTPADYNTAALPDISSVP